MNIDYNITNLKENVTYIWFLDADNNPQTGQQPQTGIGSDYNIQAMYNIKNGWSGAVFDILGNKGFNGNVFYENNSVYLIVPKNQLTLQNSARALFRSFDDKNNFDEGAQTTIVFNSPLVSINPMINFTNELFNGRLNMPVVYTNKNNPSILKDFIINNEILYSIDNPEDNPNMVNLENYNLLDKTQNYSDIVGVSYISFFFKNYGVVSNTTVILIGDPFIGNFSAFVIPADLIPKNEGNPNVPGELPFGEMMKKYNVASIADTAWTIQRSLVGVAEYSEDYEPLIIGFDYPVCGLAGFPVLLGYGCIETPSSEPFWGVIFHETGHNQVSHIFGADPWTFNGQNAKRFSGMQVPYYSEGFASLNGLYALQEMIKYPDKYGINNVTLISLKSYFQGMRGYLTNICDRPDYPCSIQDYEQRGSPFGIMSADVIDGIFIYLAENNSLNSFGWEVYPRFYKAFLPSDYNLAIDDSLKGNTFFIAGLSSATGTDLRPMFKKWNFPINDTYFNEIYPKLTSLINAQAQYL
jgi:hypothetical protein